MSKPLVDPLLEDWPLFVKLRVKELYLVNGLSSAEIAADPTVGRKMTARQISALAKREGWKAQRERVEHELGQDFLEKSKAEAKEVAQAIVTRGNALLFRGLDLADAALDKGDAKKFALSTQGVRNLASLVKDARRGDGDGDESRTTVTNLFFLQAPLPAEPIPVTPVESEVDILS